MRMNKGLVIGVAAAIGAGAVAALVPMSAISGAGGAQEEFQVIVPVGRIGDEVRYGGSWNYSESWAGTPGQGSGSWSRWSATEGPGRTVDAYGWTHDTVRWVSGWSDDPRHAAVVDHVALNRRDVVAHDSNWQEVGEKGGLTRFYPLLPYDAPHLAYQGQTYRLGENVTAQLWPESAPEPWLRTEVTFRVHVAERGTVADRPVVGIRYEQTYAEDNVAWAISRVVYLAQDSPYPVFTRYTEAGDGTRPDGSVDFWRYEESEWLDEYRPGTDPIPWGTGARFPPPALPPPERSGGADRSLEDGSAPGLAYPLARALEDAMNDPRFGPFQEWARTHDHRLVGAHSYSGWYPTSLGQPASAATVHWWNLAFADEHGNAMTVGVPRCPGSLFPTTCEASGVNDYGTIRTFPTGRTFLDLPDDPLTITGARTLLERSIPQEYQGRPINQVRWGVTWDPDGTVRDLGPETLRVELIDQPLWAGPADPPSARYWLEVNVQSGALLRLGSYANELASPSVSPVTSKAPLLQEAAAPAGAGEAPLVAAYGRSSLVASTVLAAFLAVYFYPLLKVAGAQAWTALPGYAKLRSSELLNNKFREGLLQLIRDEPGVSPPELHARVGGGWSTIVYHLGVLEKNKLVSSLIDGRHKRFFPTDALDWAKRPQVAVLRNARTRAFYGWIQEEPGLHQSDLAHRGGVRLGSAQWHLGRLERCGLVGREKRGHRVHYYPLGAAPPDPKAAVEVA